jgi:O-antigen ligase
MVVPLAMYLAQKAATAAKNVFWAAAAGILVVGAITTISRTAVAMGIAMLILAVWLRPAVLPRVLPVLLVIPLVAHVTAPGALGTLAHSFGIGGGKPLIESVQGRPGQPGSGRLDDIEPGLDLWSRSPLVGHGLASSEVATSGVPATAQVAGDASESAIIFDNQYLRTLVALGLIGLVGAVWFVWGSVVRLARGAKPLSGADGDLLAACAIACGGYGAGMAFFDSFAFVQVTLIFFIVAALGLKALVLARGPTEDGDARTL